MQETIIETAGKIWEYLNENGEVTTKKMNKDLGLNENFTSMGLGWLAREDKVNFSTRPLIVYTSTLVRRMQLGVSTLMGFPFITSSFFS